MPRGEYIRRSGTGLARTAGPGGEGRMKRKLLLALIGICLAFSPRSLVSQKKRAPSSAPQIDVQHYAIQARLTPEAHELSATAAITFKALEATGVVAFEISENLSVQKITTPDGIEVEFGQDESGPG